MATSTSQRPWLSAFRLLGAQPGRRVRTTRRVSLKLLEARTLLASNWTALTNPAPAAVGTMMLLTNGDVMATSYSNPNSDQVSKIWYLLTPNSNGSYVNGTWSTIASMSTQRLYYASNVMQNGNVFVQGGEYWAPTGSKTITTPARSTTRPPTPGRRLRPSLDLTSVTIPRCCCRTAISSPATWADRRRYLYNIASNTWTQTGTKNNNDQSDEEGWVKLPDNSILSYDVFYNTGQRDRPGTALHSLDGEVG